MSGKKREPKEAVLARIPPGKEYFSSEAVAEIMDVHVITVYRWVTSGQLRAHRVVASGRKNLYKREDLIAFVEGRYELHPRPKSRRAKKAR